VLAETQGKFIFANESSFFSQFCALTTFDGSDRYPQYKHDIFLCYMYTFTCTISRELKYN